MRNFFLMTISVFFAIVLFAGSATADPITGTYAADDASGACGGHGFWTNNLLDGCDNYFSVGSVEVAMADSGESGTIIGDAENGAGRTMTVDLAFGGFLDELPDGAAGYKQEGGGAYDPVEQDFFTMITGMISIEGIGNFNISIHALTVQLGLGANAKNLQFGLSSWIDAVGTGCAANPDEDLCNLRHWDINLNLAKIPDDVKVPEPGTVALLGLGLMGIGAAKRRRKAG